MNKTEIIIYAEKWQSTIKEYRQKDNVTLFEMAKKLEISTSLLYKYESGQRAMPLYRFLQYIDILNIEIKPIKLTTIKQ